MTYLKKLIREKQLRLEEQVISLQKVAVKIADSLLLYLSTLAVLLIIYKFGFPKDADVEKLLLKTLLFLLITCFSGLVFRLFLTFKKRLPDKKLVSELLLIMAIGLILSVKIFFKDWVIENIPFLTFLDKNVFLYLPLLSVFLVEISRKSLSLYSLNVNPARVFIYSFILLILIGTGLLLLPRATVNGISIIDALFTSTSAVCVTGLTVLDTASQFTTFGKFIILILIQLGGLGIMTFTSFFGFLFKGEFSFSNELFLQSVVNEEKMGEIFKTILKILLITFGIEMLGALMIYFSLSGNIFETNSARIGFSLFHSISAFCNAGFSTLPDGLFNQSFRFNYYFQIAIAFLVILGGLGFPIVFNLYRYVKHYLKNKWNQFIFRRKYVHAPSIINLNTQMVASTTLALLIFGFFAYIVLEWNNTLADHPLNGKIVTAFFGAVTPRTAGFNTVDMTMLAPATVLIYLFLMWIGASPGSTGGGIKTSTFAIAILNSWSIARGKERIELFKREITTESVQRSLTIIFLSFIFIGLAILTLTISDPDKRFTAIVFECFSAFSTVGLTLNLTPELSKTGKLVIITVMLIGRVGTLTVIMAFIKKAKSAMYRYPKANVFIN